MKNALHFALLFAIFLLTACRPGGAPEENAAEPEPVRIVQDYPTAGVATSADGTDVAYSSQGSGNPAVVFIHGWSCDRTYWRHQLEAFSPEHRIVSVDLAGHGDSGNSRHDWSLQAFGDDVRAVVDALGLQKVILVGHSMGGPVALEAARLLPGRVLGVVGVDALHDAGMQVDPAQWQGLLTAYRQDFPGTCDRFVRSMFLPDADQTLVQDVVQDMCAAPPEVAIRLLELFPDYDMKAAFRNAGAPIRSINAASYPTNVEGNRQFAPDYDAVVMEGVGHFLMMEKPEEFNGHLRTMIEGFEVTGTS
ncbi:MAG: alpha/beta hydrolase [Acidobacteria bacterium]|nr:alpha/beta hydrolase [Acidobacteriota bacterium]